MATTLTKKTFAELFTYSGGTNGSRVNAQGLIEPCVTPRYDFDPITKVAKGLLIESARINQLAFSSRFENAIWVRSAASAVPGAAVAPNGRWDACKLILDNGVGAGNGHIRQTVPKTAAAITFTFSCYAKPAGASNGWLYARGASSADFISIPFNLATMTASGAAGGGFVEVSKRVIDVGNGWRRVEITFTTDATANVTASIYPGSSTGGNGDGVAGIYIWGAQLESGAFASSHIPSWDGVTARASIGSYYDSKGILRYAAAGVARNSYEPSNLTLPPVLMVEEQRTNLLQRSSDMHLAPWTGGGITRTTGKLAPDGSLRAVEFSGAATTPNTQTVAATATVMTYSIYLKNVSRTANVDLLLRNTTTAVNDVGAGVVLHGANPSIAGAGWEMRPVGDGWFRCTYTSKIAIAVGDMVTCYAVVSGPRADNGACLAWGAQLEAGAYATSYIPSTETFTGRASIGTYFDSTGAMKTAAAGVARMTYNPADLTVAPWLMQEGQSKNLLLQSEQLSASPWGGSTAKTEAPEKFAGLPFWEIKKTVTTTSESASQGGLVLANVGDAFTATCVLLAGTANQTAVGLHNGTTNSWGGVADRTFEIMSGPGTVSTANGALAQISNLSTTVPTVVRVTRTYTEAGSVAFLLYPGGANSVTVGDSVKVVRPQVEPGAVASSYIPTTTAAVTRLADAVTSAATTRQADTASSAATTRAGDIVRIDATKGWCNSAEGTFFMEFDVPLEPNPAFRALFEIGDNTPSNRIGISASSTGIAGYQYANGPQGPSTAAKAYGAPVGSVAKASFSYGSDGIRLGLGGTVLAKVAAVALPPVMKFVGIGTTQAVGTSQPSFHVRALRYRPQKLTDAEVVALTA